MGDLLWKHVSAYGSGPVDEESLKLPLDLTEAHFPATRGGLLHPVRVAQPARHRRRGAVRLMCAVSVLAVAASALVFTDAAVDAPRAAAQDVDPPPAPAAPAVVDSGTTSLSASWDAPQGSDSPITGYDVRYRSVGATAWVDGPQGVTGTAAEMTGLQTDTAYQVAVRANSTAGSGEWSPPGVATTALWVSTLTVGSLFNNSGDTAGYWGYQWLNNKFGGLDPSTLTYNGTDYEFFVLAWYRGLRYGEGGVHYEALDLYGWEHEVPDDWVLRLDTKRFSVRDGSAGYKTSSSGGWQAQPRQYKVYWTSPGLSLDHGADYEVSLSRDPTTAATQQLAAALNEAATSTAWVQALPQHHHGDHDFTFELHLSEAATLSEATVRSAIEVTGGTIAGVSPESPTSNTRWDITVSPTSNAAVALAVSCTTVATGCIADDLSVTQRLELSVPGPPPEAPVITSATAISVAEGATKVARLTATDTDTAVEDLIWRIPWRAHQGGADASKFYLNRNGMLTFHSGKDLEAPDDADGDGVYEVTVQVADGTYIDTADLEVTLTNVNEAPTADADIDQTVEMGATVKLCALGTDPDTGDTLSYAWTQTSGTTVTLTDEDTETPTFTAPTGLTADAVLVFTLTVTDSGGLTATDTVTVTVTAVEPLTANAQVVPPRHDGSGDFSFQLHFSEEVDIGYEAVRDDIFDITGGTVRSANRRVWGQNQAWNITVRPSSGAAVVLELAADRACGTTGAVCTDDDRPLSNRLRVTVPGPAAAPEIGSTVDFSVAEGSTAVATLSATDADTPVEDLVWSIPAGADGGPDGAKFSLSAAGVLSFRSAKDFEAPDDADSDGVYEVKVTVTDGSQSDIADLEVTLVNLNEAPEAEAGDDQSVAMGAAVTLAGSGTDPDAGDTLAYSWSQTSGTTVTLSGGDTASATFTAPSGLTADAVLVFTLTVTDAGGLTATDTVTVTVEGPGSGRSAPKIGSNVKFSVVEGSTAVGSLTATDADTPVGDLVWSILSGAGGADRAKFSLSAAGVLSFGSGQDFESPGDADTDGVYEVKVKVSDGSLSDTADLEVSLENVNEAPSADAGEDQSVAMGAAVTLSGSGSDPDAGDTLSYSWSQTSGSTVTLSGGDTATASFTAPSGLTADAVLVFTLTVTDAGGLAATDTVTVTVSAEDLLTVSAQEVPARHDGSARFDFELVFSEEVPLSYVTVRDDLFAVTGGSVQNARRHAPPSNVRWVVTVDPSSDGEVVLVVAAGRACGTAGAVCADDGRRLSNRLVVSVPGPVPPAAPQIGSAAAFTVAEGSTAVASLSATDADTAATDLVWSIPSGAAGGADRAKFSLTSAGVLSFGSGKDFEAPDDADTDGVYEVAVKVSDGSRSDTANLQVTVTNVNEAPEADAGEDQSVAMGAAVTLAGSGSDPDAGDTLAYGWSQTSGTTVTLTDGDTATATFTAPSGLTADAVLVFTLTVTDTGGLTGTDTVTVTVEGPAPVAPQIGSTVAFSVAEGSTAVGSLSATDADTAAGSLVWSIPSGAAGGADGAKFSLTAAGVLSFASAKDFEAPDDADTDGTYEVTVKVSDGTLSDTAALQVSLTNVNEAPTADAGGDQSVAMGAAVTLAGSGSDPDSGDTLGYSWSQTSGSTVTLSGGDTATATFTAPSGLTADAVLVFTLTVTDAGGLTGSDTVTVTVEGPAPEHDWGERLADRDIALGDASAPTGLWSNGTDVWVITDAAAGDIGVYSLADGTEHAGRGYRVASSGFNTALWSDGSTLWVAGFDGAVRAYRLSDGARQAGRDLDTATLAAAGNTLPTGLWSDGTTMYVADYSARKIFAYDLATKARVAVKEFSLNERPGVSYGPFGITSDGTTIWIAEWAGRQVLAHDLATGERRPAKDISTAPSSTQYPNGVWSNGDITWILDDTAKTIRAYATPD